MHTLLLALAFGQPVEPPAIAFDTLTLADARKFASINARITFTPVAPEYRWLVNGVPRTVTGPDDVGGESRTVLLRGNRVGELKADEPITVRGTLRVIRHDAAVVGGVFVPEWDEIRFEEH